MVSCELEKNESEESKMEYAILDQLKEESDRRLQTFLEMNPGIYAQSVLQEIDEPFDGSDPCLHLYLFTNYMSKRGLIDIAIVIREEPTESKPTDTLGVEANVQCSIFPLYLSKTVFDMPEREEAPDLPPEKVKFILEKRCRPKVKPKETFDANKHRWNVNRIAESLNMSNRLVARYCRAKNI